MFFCVNYLRHTLTCTYLLQVDTRYIRLWIHTQSSLDAFLLGFGLFMGIVDGKKNKKITRLVLEVSPSSLLTTLELLYTPKHTHAFTLKAYSTLHNSFLPYRVLCITSSCSSALMPTVTFRGLMKQKVRPLTGPVSRITSQTNSPTTKPPLCPIKPLN